MKPEEHFHLSSFLIPLLLLTHLHLILLLPHLHLIILLLHLLFAPHLFFSGRVSLLSALFSSFIFYYPVLIVLSSSSTFIPISSFPSSTLLLLFMPLLPLSYFSSPSSILSPVLALFSSFIFYSLLFSSLPSPPLFSRFLVHLLLLNLIRIAALFTLIFFSSFFPVLFLFQLSYFLSFSFLFSSSSSSPLSLPRFFFYKCLSPLLSPHQSIFFYLYC